MRHAWRTPLEYSCFMDLRGDHMKMFALISIFTMSFACTVTAADIGVTATGETQIATLKWARDMGYQVGDVKGTTVYCNTVTSFRSVSRAAHGLQPRYSSVSAGQIFCDAIVINSHAFH
jgi:hypothetical protein